MDTRHGSGGILFGAGGCGSRPGKWPAQGATARRNNAQPGTATHGRQTGTLLQRADCADGGRCDANHGGSVSAHGRRLRCPDHPRIYAHRFARHGFHRSKKHFRERRRQGKATTGGTCFAS